MLYATSRIAAGSAPSAAAPVSRREVPAAAQLDRGVHQHRQRRDERVERPVERGEPEHEPGRERGATAVGARGPNDGGRAGDAEHERELVPEQRGGLQPDERRQRDDDRRDRGDRLAPQQLVAERVRREDAGGREEGTQRQRGAHDAARRGDECGPCGLVLEHDAVITEAGHERPEERIVRGPRQREIPVEQGPCLRVVRDFVQVR